MANLIMLVGIPGCGKSTWAKTFFYLHYAIVSSDEIRKELAGSLKEAHGNKISPWDEFYKVIDNYLKHDVDVIADATFLTPRHRSRLREVGDKHKAKLHAVIFKNLVTADTRNALRDEDAKVPSKVMEDMHKLYWDTLARIPQEKYESVTRIEAFD